MLNEPVMIFTLCIISFLLLIMVAHLLSLWQATRRAAAWQQAARDLGLNYVGEDNDLFERFGRFPFVDDRLTEANTGGIDGKLGDLEVTVADFVCGVDGEAGTTITVCFVRGQGLNLPVCLLRPPTHMMYWFVNLPTPLKEVRFADDVAFSRYYVLGAKDEAGARCLFGVDLRAWLTAWPTTRYYLETWGDTFLFHLHEAVPPSEARQLLEAARHIVRLMTVAHGQGQKANQEQ
jgi:hypothetical protein